MNTEDNILIAKFMGYEVINYQHNEFRPIYDGNKYAKTIGEQKNLWGGLDLQFTGRFTQQVSYPFSSDWNYLMPIVQRIESLPNGRFKIEIYNNICRIYDHEEFDEVVELTENTKIEAVYNACIEFIKWYNQQNK